MTNQKNNMCNINSIYENSKNMNISDNNNGINDGKRGKYVG